MDADQLAAPPENHALQSGGDVDLRQLVEPQDHPLRECGDQWLRMPGEPGIAADQLAAKLHELQRVARPGRGAFLRHPQAPEPGAERPHHVARHLVEQRPFDHDLPCADLTEVVMVLAVEEFGELVGLSLHGAVAARHLLRDPEARDMRDKKSQLVG